MDKLPIIFKPEKEIFYLFSFLNLTGYDVENNQRGMHSLRKFVRKRLKDKIKISQYSLLKKYIYKKHQGQFVGWLLRKKHTRDDLINTFPKGELSFFEKFDKLFQKFVNKEKRKFLWPEAEKFYFIEKKNRYPKIVKELNGLMKTLNLDFGSLNLEKIVVVPNFLDAYGWGYGPKIGKTAFIIYGPLKNEDLGLIRHEFLHSVINPLILNNKIFFKKAEKIYEHRLIGTRFKKIGYPTWPVIIEEYLVRAIDIKTRRLKLIEKMGLLKREKEKGFVYIEKIYTKLRKNYKKGELLDIFKNILDNIDKFVL